MQNDPINTFNHILELIGYEDNKEEFVKEFFELCQKQTVLDLVKSLPEEKQNELKEKLSVQLDSSKANNVSAVLDQLKTLPDGANEYFTEEQRVAAFQKAVENGFKNYLSEVMPTLSEEKKSELQNYLKSLSN
jgi:hypothetical protein